MENQPLIIGIISSAREGSNSAVLVREALRGAAEKGMATGEIYLPGYDLQFCTGCLACMRTGTCCKEDGFNELRDMLYQADGIIWGSPTYGGSHNAIMKNFFDRLGLYEVTTSSLGGKYMAGIASGSAAGAAKKVAKGLSRFGIGGTFMRSYCVGFLGAGFKGGRQAEKDEALLEKSRKLGTRVSEAIRHEKKYPVQGLLTRMLNSLLMRPIFRSYITKNKDGETRILYESLRRRHLLV